MQNSTSNIRMQFSIKEIANITGISAHTLRIWERRYELLQPSRTPKNIRYYNLDDLQYLLTISLLQKEGFKISKIAGLSREEIFILSQSIVNQSFKKEAALANMKLAMYTFDVKLFEKVYQEAILLDSFKAVFKNIFVPLLHYLGLFWHTKTITIAHEHFITNLIYQKIQLNIAAINQPNNDKFQIIYVLFLPEEEMHEISLLYLHYELLLKGYRSIYLGRSVPYKDLESLKTLYPFIHWISCFTITPSSKKLKIHFKKIVAFLANTTHEYWVIGKNLSENSPLTLPSNLKIYSSMENVIEKI